MKMPENFFSKAVLAYMPFTAYSFNPEKAWQAAALIVVTYWLTLTVFWFTRRLFPDGTAKPVFFLWLGFWGQAAWTLAGLPPLWIASVFLLIPSGFLNENTPAGRSKNLSGNPRGYLADRLLDGSGFFVFAGGFELAGEFLGNFGRSAALRGPAGIFFLIFLAALLWKNQPAHAKNAPDAGKRAARR